MEIKKSKTEKEQNSKIKTNIPRHRTIGPVPDLERHLPSDWWRTLFNSVYLKTDGDVVENDKNTSGEVDTVLSIGGFEPNDRILDLCCGQGRHSLELARRGFTRVTGLDRSRYLIRLARQRAKKQNIAVSFREGDASKFRIQGHSFHGILILGNSFGYFDRTEDDLAVLESCKKSLTPGGRLILDITDGNWMRKNFEPRSWEWVDKVHFVCRERSLSKDGDRLISREVVTHAERGVIIDQFYAERLYSEETIRGLLERAGFENVRIHGHIKTESDRGQDLGMMSHRIIISANAPTTATLTQESKQTRSIVFPRVTVLLGDPRLPDSVKRNGKFNSEDIETVQRLKRALSELEGYEFEYVDNHLSLLTRLKSKPPEFVMNLCDEGFNNNAFLELHIPAILELLNIPYTGAGPSALGICYNKSQVRAIARSLEIPTPLETYFTPADHSATLPSTFPALVKPNFGDSSVGITQNAVVNDSESLVDYVNLLKQNFPDRPILIQEFLKGAEYSLTIIGNPGLTVTFLPLLEVDYSNLPEGLPKILGYESKWEPDSPYWTHIKYHEASLSEEQSRSLIDWSMLLFEHLGCRDYARFDFRADSKGQIKLLEVNPNPGWCWDGKMNFMASFLGLRYADMLRLILEAAQERLMVYGSMPKPLSQLAFEFKNKKSYINNF